VGVFFTPPPPPPNLVFFTLSTFLSTDVIHILGIPYFYEWRKGSFYGMMVTLNVRLKMQDPEDMENENTYGEPDL